MKEKLTAFLLAVLMVAQVIAPQAAWASGNNSNPEKKQDLVKVGELDTKSYPKLDNKTILAIQKQAREKQKSQKRKPGAGFFSKDNPYLPGQNPTDEEKAAAYGRIRVLFETEGLNDNGTLKDFQWREIFGEDSNGNLTNAKIHFIQRNAKTGQELGRYTLNVNQAGEYKWTDTLGKEALLPLYSNTLEPYKYDASLEYQISDKVKLLAMEIGTTDEKTTFTKEGDKNVADIPLKLKLGQVASTKFESEWKTSLDENSRPQVEGLFNTKNKDQDNYDIENLIAFPKNNTDSIKLRNDNVDPNNPPDLPYDQSPGLSFRNVPEVKVVEGLDYSVDPDNGTPTYNFDEANKIITTLDGKHKFKYDFSYDVINGGKLTMTEILPVIFDANGGKFASITDENAEQKIVKEVEYDGMLTDKAENPTKDRETFKGWSTTEDGKNPVTDQDFKNIKEAKTFYAIWGNNEITADELTVHESFNDGTKYVNDFIPTLDQLKAQVKIKDAKGDPQPLAADDTFAIVDGTKEYTTDDDALKNYLYDKLKEEDTTEVSRKVTVKAKVIHQNGTSQTVEIPIKVIKNIYEAKTLTEKPFYVPGGYVKVTLDPTNKAQDPQKTVYYVNPEAKVVIPGNNPVGEGDNEFTKWLIDGTTEEYKLADKPRHQFKSETTIKAQYVSNVIPQEGEDKPGNVPDNYVLVEFKDGGKGTLAGTTKYWVNPTAGKKLSDITHPTVTADDGWKQNGWDKADSTEIKGKTEVTAQYLEKVLTKEPTENADKYVKVEFTPGNHGTIESTETSAYWVLKDEAVTLTPPKVTPKEGYIQKTGDDAWLPKVAETYSKDATHVAQYNYTGKDVIPQDGDEKPNTVPDNFVQVIVDKTDKAKLDDGENQKQVFWVKPATKVRINVNDPVAKDSREAFAGWKDKSTDETVNLDQENTFTKDVTEIEAFYGTLAIPQLGKDKPDNVPKNFIRVFFDTTDKAKVEKRYTWWVAPNNPSVKLTLDTPVGKDVKDGDGVFLYKWKFYEWENKERGLKCNDPKKRTYELDTNKIKDGDVFEAEYELDFVIPYDPAAPFARPEGYARVTFEAENGLKLEKPKAYYVKKSAGVQLKDKPIIKPGVTAETGYKFDKWDKEDTLVIREDIVVTAKATKLDNVIPEKDKNGNDNEKPEGYKEVIFVIKDDDKTKGKLEGVTKFYVNPTEYVTINPPKTTANTGFEFGTWDKDATIPTVYDKDATITGSFNGLKDVIPNKNPDGTENKKPDGYKTVTFVIDPATGGKIVDGETKVYFVNPAKDVTVPQPKTNADTGYVFEKWDQDTATAKKYDKDTTVKGNFKKLEDIIPSTDEHDKPNAKPDGYITVTFEKGEHGTKIEGKTVYYVNPKADPVKTIGEIKKPKVTPETGWKTNGWDKADTDTITGTQDITVTAKYDPIDDVIPKTTNDDTEKPEGYIKVTFEKGEHGKELTGQAVYYVNPNKAVVLKDKAPTVKPDTGYDFARWDTTIEKAIQYNEGDKIIALYNKLGDISTTEVEGYVKVEFKPGTSGTLEGTTEYWIKPGVAVNVPAPTVKPNVGYKFTGWDKGLTVTAKANDPTYEITAQYEALDDVIPQKNTDGSDKPNGYVTVKFKAVNGSLEGTTTYYVNGEKEVDLTNTAKNITKNPNVGYTADGVTWNPEITSKTYSSDAEYTFNFKKLDDVIPATNGATKPEGYVTVKFLAGPDGSLVGGDKIYYVNPKAGVKIGSAALPVPETTPKTDYEFKEQWVEAVDTNKTITDNQTHVAQFVYNPATVKLTYEAKDATSGEVPGAQTVKKGDKVILAGANTLTKDNATFKGWEIDGTKYPVGASVTLEKDSTAIAVWTTNSHTVDFDTKGGTHVPPRTVEHGKLIGQINPPTKPGYTFTGWTLDGSPFDPTTGTITGKTTLVANYVPNVIPETGNGKPDNVPKNFVPVTVDPTNKATDSKKQVFWVNPEKTVTIPAGIPEGKDMDQFRYVFTGWDHDLTAQFTKPETTIKAQYVEKKYDPEVDTYWVLTDKNVQPEPKDYKDKIKPSPNQDFTVEEIVRRPDVSKPNTTSFATVRIRFNNGATKDVEVPVFVKPDPIIEEKPYPVPGDCNNSCDQPNQPNKPGESNKPNQSNQPNIGMDALNTTDHYQYLIGYPDGNFAPNRGMTRAEVATMFTRLLRERPVKGQRYYTGFSDIQAGDWYANTVGYAVQVGIVSGYPDGSFKPNKPITRAEFAAIASRFDALAQGNNIAFNDLAPSHWGYNAIRSAASKGWISGYPDDTFRPEKAISRAEVTSITNRMLNRYADLYWIDAHRAEVIRFGDVKRSDWYFEPIMEATMGHDFIRDRDGKTEHWSGLNGKSFI